MDTFKEISCIKKRLDAIEAALAKGGKMVTNPDPSPTPSPSPTPTASSGSSGSSGVSQPKVTKKVVTPTPSPTAT